MTTPARSADSADSADFDDGRSRRRHAREGFRRGGWIAWAAAAGLSLVLLGMCGLALWSAAVIQETTRRAVVSNTISDHFAAAAAAVAAEESLERKYRLEPGSGVRSRFDKASSDLLQAMARVGRDGTPEDRVIAERVAVWYGPYRRAIDRMFTAVDAGDTPLVLRLDGDEVDPRFDLIEAAVNTAADSHHAAALASLAELDALETHIARATPAALLGGLVLVALFASVLRKTRTQLEVQRQRAVHDTLHDALTGLPNRTLLADKFEQVLRAGKTCSSTTGLLLIDLDRFKDVNDTLGHHVGDQVLVQIGRRIAASLRGTDTVARLGGDEFAVLLPGVEGLTGAIDVANRIREGLAESFQVEGVALDIDASIGVVVSSSHGDEAAILLQRADVAMYQAKRQACGVVVYDPANDEHSPLRLSLLGELRRGLERGELFLDYQPKVRLNTGEMIGVEALVRWQHPERGLVAPDDFIPLAERTGLIGPLTMWVLNGALRQVRAWLEAGQCIPVAVNVSARNLVDSEFSRKVSELLKVHGVPAALLKIEVTESAVMLEPERAARILHQLHALGVHIAIDDFGAGYTSLAQLRNLPISELKIDKSFILAMHSNEDDALIVRSMIDLGHNLNMKVVAEGVETAHAASLLVDHGCDIAQGYHVCRPIAPEALIAWLEKRPGRSSSPTSWSPPSTVQPSGFVDLRAH